MSLTIDLQAPISSYDHLSPEQAASRHKELSSVRDDLYALHRALRSKNALGALHTPKMQRVLGLLKLLPGPQKYEIRIQALRKQLTGILQALEKKMSPQGKLPEVAGQKYGADVGNEIERILRDPSLSLEEKLMMLSTTLAAKMENEIEAKMEEWAKLSSGSQSNNAGSGLGQMIQMGATLAGNMILPVIGGAIASQVAGQVAGQVTGGSQDDKNMKGKQLETQIQLLMQKMNRMTTMVSTLLQDDHKTKSSVISNMRV